MRYFYVVKVKVKKVGGSKSVTEETQVKEIRNKKFTADVTKTAIRIPNGQADRISLKFIVTPINTSFYNVPGSIVAIDDSGYIHTERTLAEGIPLAA